MQHWLDRSIIIQLNASAEAELDKITTYMQRMPYPPYLDDDIIVVLQNQLPFIILLSFILVAPQIVKEVVLEKEGRLKVTFVDMFNLFLRPSIQIVWWSSMANEWLSNHDGCSAAR